jgi:hypothetical protein
LGASSEFKDLEIVVLRHELTVRRRQVRRPALRQADRVVFAAASRWLPRVKWSSFVVTPTTLLDWQRRWVANRVLAGQPNNQGANRTADRRSPRTSRVRPPATDECLAEDVGAHPVE